MHAFHAGLRFFYPQTRIIRREIRRLPKSFDRSVDPGISNAPAADRSNMQIPLSNEELMELSRVPIAEPPEEAWPRKKRETIKDKLKRDINPPITEPVTVENQHERLAQVVTPLSKMSYQKQLRLKEDKMKDVLKALGKHLKEINSPVKRTRDFLACPLGYIIPSPELTGYRNKDEFCIHFGVDGNPKTVGHLVGKLTDSLATCVPATLQVNLKESHKHIAEKFQTYIRQSPHDVCHRFDSGGIWRNLLVRSTRSDERMAVVCIHPQDLAEDEISEIMESLRDYFFRGEGAECELSSLYLQACKLTRCTRDQAPYRLIEGKESITETLEGLSFCISPDSFLQVNTGGAEVLFRAVRELAEVSSSTTLLDVCSGTGTISLVMSPFVKGAIGIQITKGPLEDARRNAIANKVSNTQFVEDTAERILPSLSSELSSSSEVVAIVNPARGRMKSSVIRAIRQCEAVTKLVYISCKPEGESMDDFVQLASPKIRGLKEVTAPFIPKYAIPIDMLPNTYHTDVAVLFERYS